MFHRWLWSASRSPTSPRLDSVVQIRLLENPRRAIFYSSDCRKTPASSASMAYRTITRRWRDPARPGRPSGEGTFPVSGRGSIGSTWLRRIWAPTGPERGGKAKARRVGREGMNPVVSGRSANAQGSAHTRERIVTSGEIHSIGLQENALVRRKARPRRSRRSAPASIVGNSENLPVL